MCSYVWGLLYRTALETQFIDTTVTLKYKARMGGQKSHARKECFVVPQKTRWCIYNSHAYIYRCMCEEHVCTYTCTYLCIHAHKRVYVQTHIYTRSFSATLSPSSIQIHPLLPLSLHSPPLPFVLSLPPPNFPSNSLSNIHKRCSTLSAKMPRCLSPPPPLPPSFKRPLPRPSISEVRNGCVQLGICKYGS